MLRCALLVLLVSFQCFAGATETLAEFFFRYGILEPGTGDEVVRLNSDAFTENEPLLSTIWERIQAKPLASPLDVFVVYEDSHKSRVLKLEWKHEALRSKYGDLHSMRRYVQLAIFEIKNEFALGYKPRTLTFAQVQQDTTFLSKTTVMGEQLRVCGLSSATEELIKTRLSNHLKAHGIRTLHAYYFGSRVMPRAEIVKREPNLIATLPLNDKGIRKDVVRIAGMTLISDLEIMLIIHFEQPYSTAELKAIKRKFTKEFQNIFREFSVSLRFVIAQTNAVIEDPFAFIQKDYREKQNKILSPYQFVELWPNQI